jgi:hypothetical protein
MAFLVAQRVTGVERASRMSRLCVLRAGRLLADRLCGRRTLTPQERANLYVSRMPIAVLTASLGGHPSDAAPRHR